MKMLRISLKQVFVYSLIVATITSALFLSFGNKIFIIHPPICQTQSPTNSDVLKSTMLNAKVPMQGIGFMLAFRFWEQQTQGLHNFLQLQCLADSVSMRVVEPFVVSSMLSFPFKNLSQTGFLELGDLIDMDFWNKKTSSLYPPVSTFDHFLKEASRDVIINCVRYRNRPVITVPEPGFNFRKGCSKKCFENFDNSLNYLARFGFRLVRSTCSNFVDYAGSVSVEEFGENMFGKYNPRNVTVLLNEFRGLFGLYRMPLRSTCGINNKLGTMPVLPSSKIFEDVRKYSDSVIKGKSYVGVVARIERVVLHLKHEIKLCSQQVSKILLSLKSEKGLSSTFLAMDVGRFGSRGANRANLQPKGEILFDAIYGKENWTFNEWENVFSRTLFNHNPAYVANLQRTLAAKAECLIMVGGGGFQAQARSLYEKFHPDVSNQCVYRVCHTEKAT